MSNPGCTPEYNQKTRDMQEQLKQLRAKAFEANRNPVRLKQLQKQTAGLREQVAAGVSERAPKREPIQYNDAVQRAVIERDRLKSQAEALIQKGERLNQSPAKKIMDTFHSMHLFNIFTSLAVYPKLAAAVLGGHVHALISSGTISLLKAIPAIDRLAQLSDRQGAGLTLGGLKERYGPGMATAPGAALQTLKYGHSALESGSGDIARASEAYMGHMGTFTEAMQTPGAANKAYETARYVGSLPGRMHGFEKAFLSNPETYQAKFDRTLQLQKQLQAKGWSPDRIAEFTSRETTQATLNTASVADGFESKMQGKNKWNDALIGNINRLSQSDNLGANFAGFVMKSILPIVRVGPNVFKQGTSLMFGSVKAKLEAMGNGEMTGERADYILKNLGAQGTGVVLAALGIVYSQHLGGIPGTMKTKQQKIAQAQGQPPTGEANVQGVPVGAWGFHGAPFAMLQMGAGLAKVYQHEMKTTHEGAVTAALYSLGSNTYNWAERTLPYTDEARRIANTLEYGRGHGKYGSPVGEMVGNQIRSMTVPMALQQYAQSQDPYKGYRRQHNISDDLKVGVPGLREEVPKR